MKKYLMSRLMRCAMFCCIPLASGLLCMPSPPALAAAGPGTSPAASAPLTLGTELATRPWHGDLDGMITRGVIRVLTVNSKTFYFVNKGVQRGLVYDTFRLFEDELNSRLVKQGKHRHKHLKVKIVFIPVGRSELLPALKAGKGDVVAGGLTMTPERLREADFSVPSVRNVSEVVVSRADAAPLAGPESLSGREVFVRKSSSYYDSLTALNRRLAQQGKPAVMIRLAPDVLEDEDLIEMVNAGLVPLIIVDKPIADFWRQVFTNIAVHEAAAVRVSGDLGYAIRKNSPLLKTALDDFLGRHGQGDAMRNILLQRYLKSTRFVKDATSAAERRKFEDLVSFFRKYGDRYSVDWVLMAAQGYQESGLDQEVRSKAGAIGVMQVMPATARELDVGDIRKIEPNIHAGVKYMRWMIDQYYGKEPMTQLDKALFAFASYNAGPARIAKLRKEAAERGLDPNVWFHNVEYIAAERIGAETVTYVSNIFKYYIAYTLILENREKKQQAVRQLQQPIR